MRVRSDQRTSWGESETPDQSRPPFCSVKEIQYFKDCFFSFGSLSGGSAWKVVLQTRVSLKHVERWLIEHHWLFFVPLGALLGRSDGS